MKRIILAGIFMILLLSACTPPPGYDYNSTKNEIALCKEDCIALSEERNCNRYDYTFKYNYSGNKTNEVCECRVTDCLVSVQPGGLTKPDNVD